MGQSFSIHKGIELSKYSTIVTIDGDGQNNPKNIIKLLDIKFKNNFSLVGGIMGGIWAVFSSGDDKENKEDQGNKDESEEGKPKDDKQDDGKNNDGKEKKEQQQPQQGKGQLSPQQIQNLLETMANQEAKVQEKLNAKKAKAAKVKTEKDW